MDFISDDKELTELLATDLGKIAKKLLDTAENDDEQHYMALLGLQVSQAVALTRLAYSKNGELPIRLDCAVLRCVAEQLEVADVTLPPTIKES